MEITVKLFAHFSKLLKPGSEHYAMNIQVEDGAKIGAILEQCKVPLGECRLVMINGITHISSGATDEIMDVALRPGDALAVLPNVH
jgi:hypothetical protein